MAVAGLFVCEEVGEGGVDIVFQSSEMRRSGEMRRRRIDGWWKRGVL